MSDMTEEERALKLALLKIDVQFRQKQSFWETPKAILLIVTATAVIAGLLGYKLGNAPQSITVHFDQPLAVQLQSTPGNHQP